MNIVLRNTRFLVLALPGLLALACLTSCSSTPKTAQGPRFFEEGAANLVIRYSSDTAIFRLKPDGHEGPFYRIYTREQLCQEDATRAGRRDLAVVLIGYQWTPELDLQVKQGWVETLRQLNYRRVVLLRSGSSDQVNGLRVVEDRQIPHPSSGFAGVEQAKLDAPLTHVR